MGRATEEKWSAFLREYQLANALLIWKDRTHSRPQLYAQIFIQLFIYSNFIYGGDRRKEKYISIDKLARDVGLLEEKLIFKMKMFSVFIDGFRVDTGGRYKAGFFVPEPKCFDGEILAYCKKILKSEKK